MIHVGASLLSLDGPVVGLLAEDLAELVVRLDPRLSARRDQLLHVGPADVGDEAAWVVDGGDVHPWCAFGARERGSLAVALIVSASSCASIPR